MRIHRLHSELWLPREPSEVFPFFADAANLQRITPPWLHFEMLTRNPVDMRVGTLIDYRLRIRGFPIRWRSEITVWDPPHRFVDEQRRGPYRLWVHEHTFTAQTGGTLVGDTVSYAVRFGVLVHKLLVGPDLRRIFDYRKRRIEELIGGWPKAGEGCLPGR